MDERNAFEQRRAALFVDFDNIYLGLRQLDPGAAEEFATNPGRWLAWLERYHPGRELGVDDPPRRRILLRNCYLNPRSFSRYRSDFSRAAFRVVDCPPVTRQGKASTDIHMVMDILDTLGHTTRFDEVILLSADADFTPVLFRLRHHDRRTFVVSVGPASPTYKNAADVLVSEEEFVALALGGWRSDRDANRVVAAAVDDELLDAMADALVEALADHDRLDPPTIPRIYVRFTPFRESTDWLGHWSLRGLTEALVARRPEALRLEDDGTAWTVMPAHPSHPDADDAPAPAVSDEDLAAQIVRAVSDLVGSSLVPVPMASAAQHVLSTVGRGAADSDWAGAGSFKALLAQTPTDLVLTQLSPTRWVILDPDRHEVPEDAEAVAGETPLARLARRISRTTSVPALTPEQYALLFETLGAHLASVPYDLTDASKTVRDKLVELGSPVSRTSVSFVLRGLTFAGHDLEDAEGCTPAALAGSFRAQVRSLCEDAELHLTDEEETLVDQWIASP